MNSSSLKHSKAGAPRAEKVPRSLHPPKLEPTKKAPSVLITICKKKGYFLFFFLALKNGLKGAVIYTRFLLIAQNCAAFVLEAKK